MMKFSILATIIAVIGVTNVSSAQQRDCCLCDSCDDVPQSRAEIILLHNDDTIGDTCEELAIDMMDIRDEGVCASLQKTYQHACCSEDAEIIDLDAEMAQARKLGEVFGDEEKQSYSFFSGARELFTNGFYATSSASSSSRTYSSTGSSTSSRTSTVSRSSSISSSTTSSSSTVRRPSTAISASQPAQSAYSPANSGGGCIPSDLAVCTRNPTGVKFCTAGGNAGFTLCRNGQPPTAVAQGATILDPHSGQTFSGSCQTIDSYYGMCSKACLGVGFLIFHLDFVLTL